MEIPKTAGLIDETLISAAGYALPEPIPPDVFTNMIDESRKYRALMKHRPVRLLKNLLVL